MVIFDKYFFWILARFNKTSFLENNHDAKNPKKNIGQKFEMTDRRDFDIF
mgnify:CR=1 FL=1